MMKKYPDSTYHILAHEALGDSFRYDEVIDWATEMLWFGYETPDLLILAGIAKPTNVFECRPYLDNVIQELNLGKITGEGAHYAAVWMYIVRMSKGINVRQNLYNVYQQYRAPYDEYHDDFRFLYYAWNDLCSIGEQYDIPVNIKLEDMEDLVITTAKEYVATYEHTMPDLITVADRDL